MVIISNRPANDASLVAALLAFANGEQVAVQDQDGREVPWSRWFDAPTTAERSSLAELLQQVIDARPRLPRALAGLIELPMSRQSITRPELMADMKGPLLPHSHYFDCLAHMHASVDLLVRADSFEFTRQFANVAAALMYGATLVVLNANMPGGASYRQALSRCKLPRCDQFYLARKKPKGGPPNRSYCVPAHGDEHHNSAERAASRKAAPAARKHK